MPFIIKPEVLNSMTPDATPNTVVKRDDAASIEVALKFPEWARGYPLPMHLELKESLNILTWDGSYSTDTSFSGGTGTEDDPYIISNPSELAFLSQGANGTTADKYYKIADDIDAFDMNGTEGITLMSTPDDIENATNAAFSLDTTYTGASTTALTQFSGNFDGNNIIIYNLRSSGRYAGLFPAVTTSSTLGIKNVIIKSSLFNSTATASYSYNGVGAVVGAHTNYGAADGITSSSYPFPIENCVVMDCVFSGYGPIAQLCGNSRYAPITIENCLVADNSFVNCYSPCSGLIGALQTTNCSKIIKNTIVIGYEFGSESFNFSDVSDSAAVVYTNTIKFVYNGYDFNTCYTIDDFEEYGCPYAYPRYINKDTLKSESIIQHTVLSPTQWRASCINSGESVTLDYLIGLFGSTVPMLSQLKSVSDKQSVSCLYVTTELELDYNCMYFIWSNNGSADATFKDSVTNEDIIDGGGKDALPSMFCCFLFLPDKTYNVSSSGAVLQSQHRCMLLGASQKPTALTLWSSGTIVTKQFYMDAAHNVKLASPSGGLTIFKIQL